MKGNSMKSRTLSFAEIGDIFDDATTRMVGGVNALNKGAILKDIARVQTGLEQLLEANPDDFQGVAGIHAQNIIDQLNLERDAIKALGSDPFAPKYINDVQRDLIDIVQGDDQLLALATEGGRNGFAAVPDLLVPPSQFQGNAEQTAFMRNFAAVSQDFADRAVALVEQNASDEAKQQFISEVREYADTANAFTRAQGGLYSARFDNEFAQEGVHGTASRALIDGLETGNADKVRAAAEVLANNAADVAGNMLGIGDDPPAPTGNGIPDQIESFAQAGTIFNDATSKLIGGVYDGNRQSVHDDLTAARQGIVDLLAQDQFDGRSEARVNRIVDLLGRELKIIDNADAGPLAATRINDLHSKIIDMVQKDATLAAAATEDGANGFMALPGTLTGRGPMNSGHGTPVAQDHGHRLAHATETSHTHVLERLLQGAVVRDAHHAEVASNADRAAQIDTALAEMTENDLIWGRSTTMHAAAADAQVATVDFEIAAYADIGSDIGTHQEDRILG